VTYIDHVPVGNDLSLVHAGFTGSALRYILSGCLTSRFLPPFGADVDVRWTIGTQVSPFPET
jgi:hypothetical protein